jgi:hypothetical protein
MIAVVIVATYNYAHAVVGNFAAFLVWFHVIIHAPFSIAYHCNHNKVVGDYDIRHLKRDIVMIYISNFVMHIALSLALPWPIAAITTTVFACASFHAADTLARTDNIAVAKQTAIGFAWIFLFHYFPIVFQKRWDVVQYHLCIFLPIFGMYKLSVVARLTQSFCEGDNAIMHCALIASNTIAHHIVTSNA